MTDGSVRRLGPGDARALVTLRREALETEPLAFLASPEDDRALSEAFVRDALAQVDEQAVFGAFRGERLSGMVGLVRAAKRKERHKALIWGMYVAPEARAAGTGRGLLDAALACARGWPGVEQVHLSVSETATTAARLYESAGFEVWGREPRAVAWRGRYADEIHLVLTL